MPASPQNGYGEDAVSTEAVGPLMSGATRMMESEEWPFDAQAAADLVARVIADVDDRGDEGSAALLTGMLSAAWPTCRCQDQ